MKRFRDKIEEGLQIRDAVFTAMHIGLVITDPDQPDHPIIDCNPAFEQLTGYGREEVLGLNCRFLQNDDRMQKPVEEVRAAINEHRPCRVVLRKYRKDGTLFWNELSLSPIFDHQGHLTHFVGLQHDISDLVQASKDRWEQLANRIETLAPRQREVMDLLVAGKHTKAIAAELGISTKSVETHRTRLLKKMTLDSVLELVRLVITSSPYSS